MEKTKTIVLLIAASVLVAVVAGIAYAQFASAQANAAASSPTQTPRGTSGNSYMHPQQGYCPYSSAQNGSGRAFRMGMGMCGQFW